MLPRRARAAVGRWALAGWLASIPAGTALAQEPESAVLKVFLNTEDKGERFAIVTPAGDVLLSRATLADLGFRDLPETILGAGVSLRALAPRVQFLLDRPSLVLTITADPVLLRGQLLDLGPPRAPAVLTLDRRSAFLNYDVGLGLDDRSGFGSLSLFAETGIRLGDYLGYSSASYSRTPAGDRLVRLLSQITADDLPGLRRYTLGDVAATSGPGGGSGLIGGIGVSTDFALNPYFVRTPGLDLGGLRQTPTELEVYVNDILVRRETLAPGEFRLLNLPVTPGQGAATLVLRDPFGREERISTLFYRSSLLLRPGVHEYSYALGLKRREFGVKSFDYAELAFAGYHRVGLSEGVTSGLRAEATRRVANLGPTATFLLGTAGEVTASVAGSQRDGRPGLAASASYTYSGQGGLSTILGLDYASREYATIFAEPAPEPMRLRGLVGAGLSLPLLGSLSATYAIETRYGGADTRRLSVIYTRQLLPNLTLTASISHTDARAVRDEVLVGFTWLMDSRHITTLASRVEEGRATTTATLQRSPPLGTGAGYRVAVEGDDDDRVGGEARLQYRGPHGVYEVDYTRSLPGQSGYALRAAGSVALLNGGVYFGRPITDGFALVQAGGLEGVRILYSNQEVGVTNLRGEALVPELVSHYDNPVTLEVTDLPLGYSLADPTRYVSPPFRGGGVVPFGVSRLQAFEGRLFFEAQGHRTAAEYAALEVELPGRTIESAVGKSGAFYLENLPPGTFAARLLTRDRECRFELIVPASDALVVELGDLACEVR